MQGKTFSIRLQATLITIITVTLLVASTYAATEKVLHTFCALTNCPDGSFSQASLIFDGAGNLYGTTTAGGIHGQGTVFELTPKAAGGWTEKVLHDFNNNGKDGFYPGSNLVFDAAGNLYGTTELGGTFQYGTVFELAPRAGGGWTEKVLHSFNANGKDGFYPVTSLILDAAGNLYGVAIDGGTYGNGAVFELTPKAGGGWTEKVAFSFEASGMGGQGPTFGLVFDAAGNLFGATFMGGAHGGGTVFELTPKAGGGWTEKVLHSFNNNGKDGWSPNGGLILDAAGNLYGTTSEGGADNSGTVFELTPYASGAWAEKLLHSFNDNGMDGYFTTAGLIFDATGNLYGTTYDGGSGTVCAGGCGTVFEVTRSRSGGWTEKVVHSFNLNGRDGGGPAAGLTIDAAGNLYGTTFYGGADNSGTVFEIKP